MEKQENIHVLWKIKLNVEWEESNNSNGASKAEYGWSKYKIYVKNKKKMKNVVRTQRREGRNWMSKAVENA